MVVVLEAPSDHTFPHMRVLFTVERRLNYEPLYNSWIAGVNATISDIEQVTCILLGAVWSTNRMQRHNYALRPVLEPQKSEVIIHSNLSVGRLYLNELVVGKL